MLSVVTVFNTFDPTLYGQIRDYVCHNTIVKIKKERCLDKLPGITF